MRTQLCSLLRMAITLGLCLVLEQARADIYVIANANIADTQLSQQQIADLYLGRTHTTAAGEYVTLLDQSDSQAVRERFFKRMTNMSLSQVNAYWARLTFTGRQAPPQTKANDLMVIQAVARTPGSIGYVGSVPSDAQVRVILHLHE
jgi:ABC-type phosphate transport system substrate-binding protein